jgi:hypothetical protein
MVRRFPLTLLAHSVVAGLALWLTCGSFELVIRSREAVRVAMLPPFWLLPLLVAGIWLLLAGLYHGALRWRAASADAAVRTRGGDEVLDALRPLAATSLLVVPYLPWLPDAVPVLRLLGGPARLLVWIIVLTQVARLLWNLRPAHDAPHAEAPPRAAGRPAWQAPAAIALVTFGVCGAAALAFTRSPLFPGGDEPHYLVMAQSLWRDGDLKIENNHRRGDYREYFESDLQPHYLTRGRDGAIYSVHPIGMPVLMAPVYALGGYRLVAWTMVAFATGAATLLWVVVRRITESATVATVGWAACCLTGPFVFNSFTVYPEIPAALTAMLAFTLAQTALFARSDGQPRDDQHAPRPAAWGRWLACGLAAATLPWFSTKYAPMSAALILIALGRIWWRADDPAPLTRDGVSDRNETERAARGEGGAARQPVPASAPVFAELLRRDWPVKLAASLALGLPYAISLAGWFAYFYVTWGSLSPSAPYGAQRGAGLRFLPAGGPGLLFDQEYGIVAFAPALLLALIGLVSMLRRGGAARRLAIEVGAAFGALLATVGAFHIWWGGSATVGRPLMSGFLLLGLPLAWDYQDRRAHAGSRALTHVAIAAGVAIALTLGFAQQGLLLAAGRDGVSQIADWLSPAWGAWALGPSFITQTPLAASIITAVWLIVLPGACWLLLARRRTLAPGRATVAALTAASLAIVAGSLIVPLVARAFGSGGLTTGGPLPLPIVMTNQGRSALLDSYDATRRPIALVFDPWRRVAPETVPSLVQFIARPEDRRPRQPIPLLYSARWALPAGRYTVTLVFPRGRADVVQGSIAVQVGRVGLPMQTWDVQVGAPGVWGRTFELPVDANLVGFIASPEVSEAAPELRLSAESTIDAHRRLPPAETLGSTLLGDTDTRVYFHDERVWPDGHRGFWTAGASSTAVTLSPGMMWHGAVMRLQAGPVPTQVRVRTGKRDERVTLAAHAVRDVSLPAADGAAFRLTLDTGDGFVPARVEPGNTDERLLGCHVEILGAQQP